MYVYLDVTKQLNVLLTKKIKNVKCINYSTFLSFVVIEEFLVPTITSLK